MVLFVLDEYHQPLRATSPEVFEAYYLGTDRTVAYDTCGPYVVHTVFAGVAPEDGVGTLLFVTSIDGPAPPERQRYASWNSAQMGHNAVVDELRLVA
ncbi:MAG: hypothetical protein RhofKO_21920 [Rhodothermales bacterium]